MISNTNKLITIGVLVVLLLAFAGFGFFKPKAKSNFVKVTSVSELEGRTLGGIVSKMPDASVKMLFDGMLSVKLANFKSYDSIDNLLAALRTNEIAAAFMPDVTAKYLVNNNADIQELETPDPSMNRFEFGLAVANNLKGEELQRNLNAALDRLEEDGTLERLSSLNSTLTIKEMQTNNKNISKGWDTLYVGITGTVQPLELLDEANNPYGYLVELMDNIGLILNKKIEFVLLSPKTIFTELLAGRVDCVFDYASSMVTVETKREWLMTRGYYPCKKYSYIALK